MSKWTPEMEAQIREKAERLSVSHSDDVLAALAEIRSLRDDLRDGDQAQLELEHKAARARIEGARAMQEKCAALAAEPDRMVRRSLREVVNASRAETARSIRALNPEDV